MSNNSLINRKTTLLTERHLPKTLLALAMAVAVPASASAEQAEQLVGEVVVTGIRNSVKDALEIKRLETGIVDAISAEDIASFPDENIAESIQRIPGVQIERSNGRGALISIRGLGPEFAATTLNGQAFASAQFNTGFRYDIVQFDLASAIQVYKTPNASLEEGGLAGTVDIGTAKPLSYDGRKILVGAEGIYPKDPDSTTPSGSFTYVDQLNDGKAGVLFHVGYQELDTRYDLLFNQRFRSVDDDGDGVVDFDANGIPLERVDRPRLRREDGNTERYLFNSALQFLPRDDLEVNVIGVLALDERTLNFQQLVPLFSGGGAPAPIELGRTGSTVDRVLAENIRIEANHTLQTEDRKSYALTADTKWYINDSLTAQGVIHYTAGEFDIVERAFILGIRSDLGVNLDVANPVLISNRLNPVSDPNSWAPENLFRNDLHGKVETFETDELAFQFDLEYAFDESSFLSTFKTGVKHRTQTLDTINNRLDINYRGEDTFTAPFPSIAETNIVVHGFSGGEFSGLDMNFVLPDVDVALAQFDASGTVIEPRFQTGFFEIDRDITTLYGQLDVESEQLRMRGNIGLRYARTDRKVDTVEFGGGVEVDAGARTEFLGRSIAPVSNSFDYDNWLPSLNLAFDLTEDVVLRAAAGKVLVRPVIGQTANFSRRIESEDDATDTIFTVSEGSFDLPSLTAKQFDLSAEWYFADAGAVSVSVAYFHKDVSNQTVDEMVCPSDFVLASVSFDAARNECVGDDDGCIYRITRTRTADGTLEINGVEFAYSQSFDFLPKPFDGLGVIANYTVLDAKNPLEDQPLLGSSEDTYNVIA